MLTVMLCAQKRVVAPVSEHAIPMLYTPFGIPPENEVGAMVKSLSVTTPVVVAVARPVALALSDCLYRADVYTPPPGLTGPLALYVRVDRLTDFEAMNVWTR